MEDFITGRVIDLLRFIDLLIKNLLVKGEIIG